MPRVMLHYLQTLSHIPFISTIHTTYPKPCRFIQTSTHNPPYPKVQYFYPMPLKLHYQDQDTNEYAIWQATEPAMYFRNQLQLHPAETEQLQSLNDRKQYEWLASRHLLHILSGRDIRGACLKDEFGKPYLQDSTHHI